MAIQIRNYNPKDLELLVVLLNAVDAVDRSEIGTSVLEKRERLSAPEVLPEQNVFVAEDESGKLVGVAYLHLVHHGDKDGFRNSFEVHPAFRGRGLEDRLLARLEQRAQERMAENRQPLVYYSVLVQSPDQETLRAVERAGLKEVRRFWVMVRPHLADLPTVQIPEGFDLRPIRLGEDDAEVLDAMNDAFSEHYSYVPDTMEWYRHYTHSNAYRKDLTVLAYERARDRVAGFCHVSVNEGECARLGVKRGWIDELGVRKEYRRCGLGEALILQGMHNIRNAGMTDAVLGCDSQNTTNATALYFRTGYHVHKTDIAFDKLLRAPTAEPQAELAAA